MRVRVSHVPRVAVHTGRRRGSVAIRARHALHDSAFRDRGTRASPAAPRQASRSRWRRRADSDPCQAAPRPKPARLVRTASRGGNRCAVDVVDGVGQLMKRRDVVEDPERPSLRGGDEIVVLDRQVGDRYDRQIELQRLPLRAVVQRVVDAGLRAREEQVLCASDPREPSGRSCARGCRTRSPATMLP